jgi:hypothetical protein
MYMKIDGKWSLAGSIKDLEQTEQQLKRDAHSRDVCRSLKDETVNGSRRCTPRTQKHPRVRSTRRYGFPGQGACRCAKLPPATMAKPRFQPATNTGMYGPHCDVR